jgi:hypothetical protein
MAIVPNAPVGTITMYGGSIRGLRLDELHQQGWLPCNGQSYAVEAYPALYKRIKNHFGGDDKTFHVPDMRGRFARGTDRGRGKDPGVQERQALFPGGNTGDAVGSVQGYATKLPVTNIVTDPVAGHSHGTPHQPTDYRETPLSAWGPNVMSWTDETRTSNSNGNHFHTIVDGGDSESRPVNIYLFWLIKYQ